MTQHTPSTAPRLTGPPLELERHFPRRRCETGRWFRARWLRSALPFHASVDIRNAGTPLDTNPFPAGFDNLSPEVEDPGIQAVQSAAERLPPDCRGVPIIREDHTRNQYYWRAAGDR